MTNKKMSLSTKIMIGMALGLLVGVLIKALPSSPWVSHYLVNGLFDVVGKIFINLLEMIVVPIVFVSLVCGTAGMGDGEKLGKIGIKVFSIFVLTTAIAASLGLFFAHFFHVGSQMHVNFSSNYTVAASPGFKQMLIDLVPSNPFQALSSGNLLQVIVFAILIGAAMSFSGEAGKKLLQIFEVANQVLMNLIMIIMRLAPIAVFCLIAEVFATLGIDILRDLLMYMLTILFVLLLQLFGVYGFILSFFARLNPISFFKKMYSVMLFAFSTSSSNASIPISLKTAIDQLGVEPTVATFAITLGATINKNGTAIMQAVATVFIAEVYHVTLSLTTYGVILVTIILSTLSTAGVPSVGIITLAMVLQAANLPIQGVGLIIGIDRIIDMCRTVVNVTGSVMTACVVSKSEKTLNKNVYQR